MDTTALAERTIPVAPDAPATVSVFASDQLTISRRVFKKLWRDGHINDASYAILAMYFDEIGQSSGLTDFDLNDFAVKWSEHWQVDKEVKGRKGEPPSIKVLDQEKQLTEAQINGVLGKLEKKECATVSREIQINISWEA